MAFFLFHSNKHWINCINRSKHTMKEIYIYIDSIYWNQWIHHFNVKRIYWIYIYIKTTATAMFSLLVNVEQIPSQMLMLRMNEFAAQLIDSIIKWFVEREKKSMFGRSRCRLLYTVMLLLLYYFPTKVIHVTFFSIIAFIWSISVDLLFCLWGYCLNLPLPLLW